MMPYSENLTLFLILLTGVLVVPGMDMAFVLANALTGGKRSGLAATAGIMTGGVCHAAFGTLAATGLSALVPILAKPMITVGSLYVMWIGIGLARSAVVLGPLERPPARPASIVYVQALATCLLNPKAWIFVLAVFPQFIKPNYGSFLFQGVVIGVATVVLQAVVYGGLALTAARGQALLARSPALTVWTTRIVGLMLVAIAVSTLIAGWREF
ncbi:MAG: LysE family translocator [Hyphomicrobiales bacterium]|nr:LysE family translocator [Hyphomicrobiales bacterium]